MSNIFVEVDEAMKQERLERLWRRYGGFFLGFLAIIILGTAVNAGYNSWKSKKNIEQTDMFLGVVDKEGYSSQDLLDVSESLTGGLHDIAVISAAGLTVSEGDLDKALAIYSGVAEDVEAYSAIRQLASYMVVNLSKDLSVEDKLAELETIFSNKKNPWRYHARLDAALIEANMVHDYTKAIGHLDAVLAGDDVPKSLKQKSQSLKILYAALEKTDSK